MDHDEIVRLYGPWRRRTPDDAADLLRGYPGRWWIAGGWAIEAFAGVPREHGDLDLSIPRSDVPLLREHLLARLDLWAADRGTLTPLVADDVVITPTCSNVWLRASGADPWEYDVILMDVTAERWTYKRDARISLPAAEILWSRDGLTYLKPEVQLLHKAPGLRPKDQHDFDGCRPLLGTQATSWLRTALDMAHPGHPWLAELS
ncbi:MAG: hypothetical protein JWP75_3968 [Frondihabitans sp.]|nr:hypothetical protein [Frondihabitans sp.]